MNRREVTAALGAAAASPLLALAQPGEQIRRVGVLMPFLQDDPAATAEVMALQQGLADLGWIEGRNVRIELRWHGGDVERAQALAKELVALKPDVLLARSTPATAALKRETDTIPIVFAVGRKRSFGKGQPCPAHARAARIGLDRWPESADGHSLGRGRR